jgi:hypothetical protein
MIAERLDVAVTALDVVVLEPTARDALAALASAASYRHD